MTNKTLKEQQYKTTDPFLTRIIIKGSLRRLGDAALSQGDRKLKKKLRSCITAESLSSTQEPQMNMLAPANVLAWDQPWVHYSRLMDWIVTMAIKKNPRKETITTSRDGPVECFLSRKECSFLYCCFPKKIYSSKSNLLYSGCPVDYKWTG